MLQNITNLQQSAYENMQDNLTMVLVNNFVYSDVVLFRGFHNSIKFGTEKTQDVVVINNLSKYKLMLIPYKIQIKIFNVLIPFLKNAGGNEYQQRQKLVTLLASLFAVALYVLKPETVSFLKQTAVNIKSQIINILNEWRNKNDPRKTKTFNDIDYLNLVDWGLNTGDVSLLIDLMNKCGKLMFDIALILKTIPQFVNNIHNITYKDKHKLIDKSELSKLSHSVFNVIQAGLQKQISLVSLPPLPPQQNNNTNNNTNNNNNLNNNINNQLNMNNNNTNNRNNNQINLANNAFTVPSLNNNTLNNLSNNNNNMSNIYPGNNNNNNNSNNSNNNPHNNSNNSNNHPHNNSNNTIKVSGLNNSEASQLLSLLKKVQGLENNKQNLTAMERLQRFSASHGIGGNDMLDYIPTMEDRKFLNMAMDPIAAKQLINEALSESNSALTQVMINKQTVDWNLAVAQIAASM